ncbi:MAG: CAP domain-containing protein [Chloroflexota bacterium]
MKLFLGPGQALRLIFISYFLVFTAACAPEVTSTPTRSNTPVVAQPTIPTVSAGPTATIALASTSDIIRLPSPTAQPISSTPGQTSSSDTLDLATLTFDSPLATSSPTIFPQPTLSIQSPGSTPSPPRSPAPQPESTPPALELVSPLGTPTIPPALVVDLGILESELIKAVNAERLAHGLPPYQVDEALSAVAGAHAQDMANRGYRSHVTPEGKTYLDRLAEAGIMPRWWGENIALSVRPAEEAVADTLARWLSDAPHQRNVLHPQHTHIGVGVAQTPEGWYVFVMDLIKP